MHFVEFFNYIMKYIFHKIITLHIFEFHGVKHTAEAEQGSHPGEVAAE